MAGWVGDSGRVTLVGRLRINDTTHSGKEETGRAEPVPLSNPLGAEVVLRCTAAVQPPPGMHSPLSRRPPRSYRHPYRKITRK
jgi:hypothetical protein